MSVSNAFTHLRGIVATLVIAAVAASTAMAGTTGKIAGKVTRAQTKEALPGVNVLVAGTVLGASTDAEGDYVIPNVPPGVYTLKARAVGFREVTVTGVRVHADATTGQHVAMEEIVLQMAGEVTVTAERPLVEKDNTASMVSMETEEITAHPTESVAQVLSSLPGIEYGGGGELQVRGSSLNEVSVLIDGARNRNPVDQSSFVSGVSLRAIQEMNVIRGTFNAEYGEAQTGVFQITTREGGEKYGFYVEERYTPPGIKHWGPSLYDPNTTLYWENTHARHLEWWLQYPDQWVDNAGLYGNDPRCSQTPEQAYAQYLATHRPLTDYTKIPSSYTDIGVSGPVPFIDGANFFISGNYNSVAPLQGNSFLSHGTFINGNAKLTFSPAPGMKLTVAGAYSKSESGWGVTGPNGIVGLNSRYAYFEDNYGGLPGFRYDAQTLRLDQTLDRESMYEVLLSRGHTISTMGPFPGDPIGYDAIGPQYDNLRAIDANGNPLPVGYETIIGWHTTGYLYRYRSETNEWNLKGFYSRQFTKNWEMKAGIDGTYYNLNQDNTAKLPDRTDRGVYNPFQGAGYAQSKLEFEGLIVNAGLRLDFYAPNNVVYLDMFDPLNGPTEKTKIYTQISPRLGIAHPIDEKTVLHFSYGHFFQSPPFGDYGEGSYGVQGSLTTFVVNGSTIPWALGNRALKPQKTVSYEIGIERNFADVYLLSLTAYYKDYTNVIKQVSVQMPDGAGVYQMDANGPYGDGSGFEVYLRKLPSDFIWGYANFTTRSASYGSGGSPDIFTVDGTRYSTSVDQVDHFNPILKAGLTARTPASWDFLGGVFRGFLLSVEYRANFPNKHIKSDVFTDSEGNTYLRPVYQNTDLRLTKELSLGGGGLRATAYVEVHNLFNNKWINLGAADHAAPADRDRLAHSGFTDVPYQDIYGVPYHPSELYYNLPRAIVFGASLEL